MLHRSITLVTLLLASNEAMRILVVFPLTSKSHSILGHGVVNRLLEAGHKVVHLTGIPSNEPLKPNLKEILVPDILMQIVQEDPISFQELNLKNSMGKPNFGDTTFFLNLTFNYHRLFLQEKVVTDVLGDPKEKFDAVIVEWFFSDVIAGIAPLYQCPLIWFGSTEAHWQVMKLIDAIPNPAYNVDIFSATGPPLDFWERVMELWILVKKTAMIKFLITSNERALYDSVFAILGAKRGVQVPSYDDAVYNGSLLLLNSHPSIGTPFNLPQNAKYIGGYHVSDTVPSLPEDLQNLMDTAKHGVIFFSMGTHLKSVDMSLEMRQSILQMFAKFKQTIIWKFEDELESVPGNIHLIKWAPQQSILAHPNLKLFITHGGQLSTTEAIHYGVPVIGIPVRGDQHVNMNAAERKGFSITLKLAEDIAEQMAAAISRMLSNSSYKQRAEDLYKVYHDRPVSPGKELVHWVEHVVKTRGAPHLRSPALMLPWYQRMYLDLAAILFFVVLLVRNFIKSLIPSKKGKKISKKAKTN